MKCRKEWNDETQENTNHSYNTYYCCDCLYASSLSEYELYIWKLDFPSENTIVYQVKPSPSFTNDGIYYEVQESKSKKLPITLSNKKNKEIEEEFHKYTIEAKVSQKQLPDFTKDYKYYKKSDVGRSLIVVAQRHKLYIASYNL